MNEIIKQFQNIFLIDLNLKPSIVLKINDAIPNSEKNTVAYVIEHYSAIAKNLSSNERQELRKALKEVGVPEGLLPGKGRPKHEDRVRDLNLVGRPIEEDAPDEELESPVELEEPKESALKESVEKVVEKVKELTDSVKDAIAESQNPATMLGVDVDGDKKLLTTKPIPAEDVKKAIGMASATISGNAHVVGQIEDDDLVYHHIDSDRICGNATVVETDDGVKVKIEDEDAKEFFDSPLYKKIKKRFDLQLLFGDTSINDAIEQLKEINEEIRRLEAIREEYKEYIVDRLDEV